MSKNYVALQHIKEQLSNYEDDLSNAIQRLFEIEDKNREAQGCVIDSVVAALIFKNFNIETVLHLGEVCADGEQDALHCWLTVDGKILDIGIYGNSNYNPYYHGEQLKYPIVLEDAKNIKYKDGSTDVDTWITKLSEKPIYDYVLHCPHYRVCQLFCNSLGLPKSGQNLVHTLAKDMYFPKLELIDESPSGKRRINI